MRSDTELRTRTRELPELDVEQEVDVRGLWTRIAARWWLPLAGLFVGAVVGYALALGAEDVYRARAVVYPGTPYTPSAGAPAPSLATNPATIGEIVRSEAALRQAAAASGIRLARLRGSVSTQTVSTPAGVRRVPSQAQLIRISVEAQSRRRAAVAANVLAQRAVSDVTSYPRTKIRGFNRRLANIERSLASIKRRIDLLNAEIAAGRRSGNLSGFDQLVLVSQVDNAEQRRAQLIDQQSGVQQLRSFALEIEQPRILERAVAAKTTARSTRNSLLVGGAIGLILGALAALFWEPLTARFQRRTI